MKRCDYHLYMASIVVVISFLIATTSSGDQANNSHKMNPKRIVFNLVPHQSTTQLDDMSEDPLLNLYPMKKEPVMLVQFSLGNPPVEQYAIMDTGSRRRWVLCKSKYKLRPTTTNAVAAVALYDPLKSSSYRSLPCGDPICPRKYYCPSPSTPCKYKNDYASANVVGLLGYENFTFSTYDEGVVVVPSVFGCVDPVEKRQFSTDERFSGVFGLADFDFLSNVGGGHPRFSYCIGDLTTSNSSYSHLQLGEDVELDGSVVRLRVAENSHLSSIVESILMGDEDLNIDPFILIIDTGSRFTFLDNKWYTRILEKIKEVMLKLGYVDMHHSSQDLCYEGSASAVKGFPGLQLHFLDQKFQKPFVLNPTALFFPVSNNSFCLAIKKHDIGNVLGLWAQQGYNVGFDLGDKKLYFFTVDCSDLV